MHLQRLPTKTSRYSPIIFLIAGPLLLTPAVSNAQDPDAAPAQTDLDLMRSSIASQPLTPFDEWRGLYVNGRPVGKAHATLSIEDLGESPVAVHEMSLRMRVRGESFEVEATSRFNAATLEPLSAQRRVVRRGLSHTWLLSREGPLVIFKEAAGRVAARETGRQTYEPGVLWIETLVYVLARRLGEHQKPASKHLRLDARTSAGKQLVMDLAIGAGPEPVRVRGETLEGTRITIGRAHEADDGAEILYVHEDGRLLVHSTDAGASVPGGQSAIISVISEDETSIRGPMEPPLPLTRELSEATPEGAMAVLHDALLRGDLEVIQRVIDLRKVHAAAQKRFRGRGDHTSDAFPSFASWKDDVIDEWLALRERPDLVPNPEAYLQAQMLNTRHATVLVQTKPTAKRYTLEREDETWRIIGIESLLH